MLGKEQLSDNQHEQRLQDILRLLERRYPRARTKLVYETPFQLFVAAVLAAQTTDEQVNRITGKLFAVADTPEQIIRLGCQRLELLIQGCGLYRNKSRHLVEASRRIVQEYGGELPRCFEELIKLPRVGRKTASVILSRAFDVPALAVDTHVFRVSKRLGLARGSRPDQVEAELTKQLAPESWSDFHHRLIAHGRAVCLARKPRCSGCFLRQLCPWDSKD